MDNRSLWEAILHLLEAVRYGDAPNDEVRRKALELLLALREAS